MARNGSGAYSIPTTYSDGQTITAAVIMQNLNDIGTELTNSVARDGQTSMTGPLKASTGTAAAPSVTFGSDIDTGFFRKSANVIGVAANGIEVGQISQKRESYIPPGVMQPYLGNTAPSGWVRANGLTIGNASSGATEYAHADTEDLFMLLWNTYSNTICPVSSGRGASAAADYAANKTITLPDLRGRTVFGMDDMGNSAASRIGTIVNGLVNGSSGGTETVTLATTNLPSHTHGVSGVTGTESAFHTHTYSGTTDSSGAHTHTDNTASFGNATLSGSGSTIALGPTTGTTTSNGAHTHTYSGTTGNQGANHTHAFGVTSDATGSGTAHSNMPPAWVSPIIIKL